MLAKTHTKNRKPAQELSSKKSCSFFRRFSLFSQNQAVSSNAEWPIRLKQLCVFVQDNIKQELLPGQHLIKEGEIGSLAYIIKEGECTIESAKNPLSIAEALQGKTRKTRVVDTYLKTKRGFLSKTMNKFQFGILGKNQWVGAERLIKKFEEPFDYSAIAISKVRVFALTKKDAQKFPNEFRDYIVNTVHSNYKWIEGRAKHLIESSNELARMDPSEANYDQSLAEAKKRFPAATPYVITNIRKKQLLQKTISQVASNNYFASRNSVSLPQIAPLSVKAASNTIYPNRIANTKYQSFIASTNSQLPHTKKTTSSTENTLNAALVKYKLTAATSASRLALYNSLTPTMAMNTTVSNGKFRILGSTLDQYDKKQAESTAKAFEESKLNQFIVGTKIINLVDTSKNARPTTPNPFSLLKLNGSKHNQVLNH
eukprot:TRINITY_DN200_c0_g1_i1.p1 TRINITY_DN200_c0_g1~~TRINITY_DN200_c0_g1_i1.p1  ORF type:complete len:428 (+),score=37.72 TRINITY_DN200_c0_g1_i1:1395-2678(+)